MDNFPQIAINADPDKYTQQIIQDLILSENIVKGIDSQQPEVYTPDDLIGKNIFQYKYNPDTVTKADAYILFESSIRSVNSRNPSFVDMELRCWCMAHQSRMSMPKMSGRTRIGYLSQEIIHILNNSKKYGFGVLRLMLNDVGTMENNHHSRLLVFRTVDMSKETRDKVGSFK